MFFGRIYERKIINIVLVHFIDRFHDILIDLTSPLLLHIRMFCQIFLVNRHVQYKLVKIQKIMLFLY
ncbi:hypothetical protein C462_05383 [Halorubrum distributum JCM 13916]|uniref:Uncharacterized protein n=1 Tax=Halorubrum distributum JCM 13916 TaxID=1230455 RepID=M0PNX9_9EURY|nr:hypothetical protein C462_05383 [Halorubrum arcis JCM 13916]